MQFNCTRSGKVNDYMLTDFKEKSSPFVCLNDYDIENEYDINFFKKLF